MHLPTCSLLTHPSFNVTDDAVVGAIGGLDAEACALKDVVLKVEVFGQGIDYVP